MKIDPNSTVPVFQQIAQEIQSAIAAGVFREGEAIPSARELAMQLKVNPNTIQKAFDELGLRGVIETRRGIGKFVRKGALKNSSQLSRQEVQNAFEDGVRKANAAGLSRDEVTKAFEKALKKLKPQTRKSAR